MFTRSIRLHLARRGALQRGSELHGKAFENWVFHELVSYDAHRERFAQLKGLRHLVQDHPRVRQRVVVCLEAASRRTKDGILILPAADFCRRLGDGGLF